MDAKEFLEKKGFIYQMKCEDKILLDYRNKTAKDLIRVLEEYHQSKVKENKLLKKERIAYLKGITKYTMWADYVPNGNELCDNYIEELNNLLSSEEKENEYANREKEEYRLKLLDHYFKTTPKNEILEKIKQCSDDN